MKLRNKKTGEIKDACEVLDMKQEDGVLYKYYSLAELNEEWEDYEEPKDNNYWYIDDLGKIQFSSEVLDEVAGYPNNCLSRKLLGNYFETREEAEKAVEKLKAWKRLKDKGFRFKGVKNGLINWDFSNNCADLEGCEKCLSDFRLLFGGEE